MKIRGVVVEPAGLSFRKLELYKLHKWRSVISLANEFVRLALLLSRSTHNEIHNLTERA